MQNAFDDFAIGHRVHDVWDPRADLMRAYCNDPAAAHDTPRV